MFVRRDILRIRNRKLYVYIADNWYQPFVESDGTVNYEPRVTTSVPNVTENLFKVSGGKW